MENRGTAANAASFRIDSKSWFLTFPKCPLTKEEVHALLEAKGRPITGGVIARELHEDGSPHIHVYLLLEDRLCCRNARYWDLAGHHGNYQHAKSYTAVVQYVKKDKDYLEFGDLDLEAKLESKKAHSSYLGKRLMTEPLVDLLNDHPELALRAHCLKKAQDCYLSLQKSPLPTCTGYIPNSFGVLMPLKTDKQRHYWVYSSLPNKGKTTWLLDLSSKFRCSWYTVQENFQDIKRDSQFILVDEYSVAHLKVTQLNSMCDGTYQYPVKGGSPITCPGVIIVLAGNKAMEEVYTDPKNHPLIKARFNVINLD
jgi:Geminivirus Rep catalytic domain.